MWFARRWIFNNFLYFCKNYFYMEISISLKSHAQNQVAHLVAMLRSMDFVENVKIQAETSTNSQIVSN